MAYKIVSWNIRHFRASKIENYIATIHSVLGWAEIAFVYEDHAGLGAKLAAAMNAYEAKITDDPLAKTQYDPKRWVGMSIRVTDEYVTVVWRHAALSVAENSGASAAFARIIPGERCPAVVNATKDGKTLTIAGWHAFGPAKVSAQAMFHKLQTIEGCDVLIGDFNFQAGMTDLRPGTLVLDDAFFALHDDLDFHVPERRGEFYKPLADAVHRSARLRATLKMQEILPSNYAGSTTFTDEAFGRRKSGLDRCLIAKGLPAQLMVGAPNWFDEVFSLTDHVPLMLAVEK